MSRYTANPSSSRPSAGGHSFMDFHGRANVSEGWIIPQDVYHLPHPYTRLPTVSFTVNGQLGILLEDAKDPNFRGLDNAQFVPCLAETAKKITIRILWPGYEPWHDILHVYDHTYNANPCTMKKLARIIAQKVEAFLDDTRAVDSKETENTSWWLKQYPFGRLVLLELRHVSAGSWQPVLMALP
ncbi:hypothetical protein BC835DRAFT_1414416 [Cytidiella melzeri]|nr:hypothetical protein BC835DRAFT_1414416 [Cytidiella melzeri]